MLFFISALGIIAAYILGWRAHARKVKWDLKDLERYQNTFLRWNGWTIGYGSYALQSLDSGKTWYATKAHEDGSVEVLGPVERVYPGLMRQIVGFQALVDYVRKNGPLALVGERAETERTMLENAGFKLVSTA